MDFQVSDLQSSLSVLSPPQEIIENDSSTEIFPAHFEIDNDCFRVKSRKVEMDKENETPNATFDVKPSIKPAEEWSLKVDFSYFLVIFSAVPFCLKVTLVFIGLF